MRLTKYALLKLQNPTVTVTQFTNYIEYKIQNKGSISFDDWCKNNNIDCNKSIKGGGGNTLKRKNYNKSFKNKSSKNKRENNIENIENNIENTKIYGGARISPSDLPIYQYKTFINFCQSNSDENELSTATILDKKIYIKTKFNIETIKAYRKSSLIGAVYYGTKNLSSYVYNSLTKSATQTESDKKKQEVKLLEELKKKKLYLPFLFKDVTAIGFLKQESLQKTIDDNDILASDKDIKINWVVLDKNTIKSYLLILIDSIIKNPVPVVGLVVNSVFGSVVNPASITPAEVVLTNSAAVTILSKIAADNSTLGVDIVAAVADSSTTAVAAVADSSTTAVAAASTTAVAATTAAAEGWISSFLTYATSLTSSAVSGVTSAGTVVLNTVLAHQLAATTAILYSIVDAYRFSTDNQLDVNLIIYDSYIEAIFTTIIDTRYISMVDSDKDPAQVFIEDINKIFFDISTLLNSLKSKIRPYTMPTTASRTTIDSDILRYKGKNNEPEDIKNKLTNLNIPLRAFAYALTEVKSTYTAKTGEMLKEYYDNKDKFMQKLEEDRKKK